MPFPLSLSGRVFSEQPGVDATIERAERALHWQRAKSVAREGADALVFQGSFLNRRLGGSVLTVISRGRLRASQAESLLQVDYDLHFGQNILVRGALTAFAFTFIYFGVPAGASNKTIVVGLVFWFILAAIDYLLASVMFPRFLTAVLKKKAAPPATDDSPWAKPRR